MNKMEVNDELTNAIVGDLGHSNLFAGLEEILIAEMPNATGHENDLPSGSIHANITLLLERWAEPQKRTV